MATSGEGKIMKFARFWLQAGLLLAPLTSCTFQSEPLQEPLEPYLERPSRTLPQEPVEPSSEPAKPGHRHPSGPATKQHVQPAAVRYLIDQARQNLQAGDYNLAQSNLERAFRLANRDPWVSYYMGQVLLAQNEIGQAEQWAFQALSYFDGKDFRSKGQVWEFIASCRRQRGDLRGANQAQKQADSFHAESYE